MALVEPNVEQSCPCSVAMRSMPKKPAQVDAPVREKCTGPATKKMETKTRCDGETFVRLVQCTVALETLHSFRFAELNSAVQLNEVAGNSDHENSNNTLAAHNARFGRGKASMRCRSQCRMMDWTCTSPACRALASLIGKFYKLNGFTSIAPRRSSHDMCHVSATLLI